jgi:hypothetical protein
LIGLGPGQSIRWTERGRLRSLAVLEVRERMYQTTGHKCPLKQPSRQ